MLGTNVCGSSASSGLFGPVIAWLRARSTEIGHLFDIGPASADRSVAGSDARLRVLVVDDDRVNLMVMAARLEAKGLLPMLAADGAEAVALASELQFDLILMDLQMPVLDGFAATKAIRRFERIRSRPAVPIVSYSSANPAAGTLLRHGMHGSLSKPCGDQALEECLLAWCPAHRPIPAAGLAVDGQRGQSTLGLASSAGQPSPR